MSDLSVDAKSLAVGYALFFAPSEGDSDGGSRQRRTRGMQDDAATAEPHVAERHTIGGVPAATVLLRIREGDHDALTLVYDTLFTSLWRLAVLRTQSTETAEELVHDVFLSFWIRRATLPPTLDIRVYLAAAVRNRTRDVRSHARVVHALEESASQAAIDPPAMSQGAPVADADIESQEFWAAYRYALGLLTDREREAVLLRWEENFTLEQVGRVLGLSTMGARKMILRAQAKVQTALRDFRV